MLLDVKKTVDLIRFSHKLGVTKSNSNNTIVQNIYSKFFLLKKMTISWKPICFCLEKKLPLQFFKFVHYSLYLGKK